MSRNPVPPRVPPGSASPTTRTPAQAPADTAPAPSASAEPQVAIIARPDFSYRAKRYIMALVLLGLGPWFAYDGWKNWPAENKQTADLQHQLEIAQRDRDEKRIDDLNHNPLTHKEPHSALGINIQKVLAGALPVGGILFLLWSLHVSRGTYQLDGDELRVPGHPPVRLSEITEIDSSKWDRKGIASLRYRTASGASGKLTLDDFIYEREPTDQIYDRVVAAVRPTAGG